MAATANKTGRNRVRQRERRGLRDPQPWREALGRLGDGGKHAERRRSGGLRARARQWRRLGFARTGRRLRLGLGFQGCAGVAFIGQGWGLCVLAKKEGAAWGVRRPDSLSPRRSREVDDPDRRDPPVSDRERKGRGVGLGFAGEEGGPAEEFWAAGERKKEERGRWARPKGYREKRERLLLFFSIKDLNNSIQI